MSNDDEDAPKFPEFNAKTEMKDPHFQLGMIFANVGHFKKAMT